MRARSEIISLLTNPGVIAIIRTKGAEQIPSICEALLAGGINAIEITMTVPGALDAVRAAAHRFGARSLVGAGTVLNAQQCRDAIRAGAAFIITPVTRLEVIDAAHESERPVMIGAYTPTEAQLAYEAGADFIKIFPADRLGPSYIKNLLAPLPHLRVVPTGGVDLKTAVEFLNAGCAALGVGSALLPPEVLRNADWHELTRLAKAFVEVAQAARRDKRLAELAEKHSKQDLPTFPSLP